MKVYELSLAEGQEWVMPRVLKDNDVLSDLRGQRQRHWIPVEMEFLTENDDGTRLKYSDFPWYCSHVLILRATAANGLRRIMQAYGEFLPLKGAVDLELFNATTVLDALDEDRSEIVRFDDGGILIIERYVFRQDAIANCDIFKLPYRASNLYFQDGFVDKLRQMEFCGIAFNLVWSDEADPVREILLPPRDKPVAKRHWWER